MMLSFREFIAGNLGDFHSQVMEPNSARVASTMLRWSTSLVPWWAIQRHGELLTTAEPTDTYAVRVPYERTMVTRLGSDIQKRIQIKFGTGDSNAPVPFTLIRRSSIPSFGLEDQVAGLSLDATEPDPNTTLMLGEQGEYLLWGWPDVPERISEAVLQESPRYLVPVPAGLHPRSIISGQRTLLEGIDFAVGRGVVLFRQHPEELFGASAFFICRAATVSEPHLFDHLFSAGGTRDVRDIGRLVKGQFGQKILERALACVAGLHVIRRESKLLDISQADTGYHYVFDTGLVRAEYAHTPLEVDTTYPDGTIIGQEMIKVRRPIPGSARWYRDGIDWSSGLSLDEFCGVQGLTAPNYPVRVEIPTGGSTGSLRHARMWLLGSDEARTRYWTAVKRAEIQTGKTLAAALGLTNEGDSTVVNPIDTLFTLGGLVNSALLVELKMDKLPGVARSRVVDFLRREKPTASTLIIR